jgi:hypothetical protein
MVAKLSSGSLLIAATIHLLPLRGVLGAEHLAALYGIPIADPSLEILLRHRAVLFGLLGAFLAYAAFKPALQPLALVAGLVSVASFIGLAWRIGSYTGAIRIVVIADVIALICLLAGAALFVLSARQSR